MEFADVLSRTPVVVSPDLKTRLEAELSEKQVTELAHLIAWENSRARFNRGLGVEADGYGQIGK